MKSKLVFLLLMLPVIALAQWFPPNGELNVRTVKARNIFADTAVIQNGIIEITYTDLVDKINTSMLAKGMLYKIVDFRTIQTIPYTNTVNMGAVEPLIVLAIGKNILSKEAYSEIYPNDKIWYKVDSAQKGVITKRIDDKNNEATYDLRTVKYRRWKVVGCPDWTLNATYEKNTIAKKDNITYLCLENDTTSSIEPANNIKWARVYTNSYFAFKDSVNYGICPTTRTDTLYQDFLTFNGDCHDNKVSATNIVFVNGASNNIIGKGQNMTFGGGCYNNVIGDSCYNITAENNFIDNVILQASTNLYFGDNSQHNQISQTSSTFSTDTKNNKIECSSSYFGTSFTGNIVTGFSNVFGRLCEYNIINGDSNIIADSTIYTGISQSIKNLDLRGQKTILKATYNKSIIKGNDNNYYLIYHNGTSYQSIKVN